MAQKKAATTQSNIDEKSLVQRLSELERENEQLRNNRDDYGIRLDSYIPVVSLYPGKLTLATEKMGKGKTFSFPSFGTTKRILYNDLASVLENYSHFMEWGYFYILDRNVVRKHGLDDLYDSILSKEMIEKVIDCRDETSVQLYESASERQRENIENMIISKLKNGEALDLNILSQISKIAEKDLEKLAKDALELETIPEV